MILRYPFEIFFILLSLTINVSLSSWLSPFYYLASKFTEVCYAPSISFDSAGLESSINQRLFGQPLVKNVVVPLLKLHLSGHSGYRKALVLSFHGTPGSGKNHAAKIIAESIYKEGMDSKFVHLFKPILHFADRSPEILKLRLQEWIIGNITACDRQLFIFDEVNDMPEGILEAVKGFIDYNPRFGRLDYSKSIFIFLSNIAMVPINQKALELWQSGIKQREHYSYDDFAKIVIEHSFNDNGGFKKCQLISNRLIDAFVPFLPLERPHVIDCIKSIASEYSPQHLSQEVIDSVVKKIEFVPDGLDLYSSHGCKNLDTPVKLALLKHNYRMKFEL